MSLMHHRWLAEQLPAWEREGIVTAEGARTLRQRYAAEPRGGLAQMVVGASGALLIGTGLIAVLAYNWDDFPRWVRIALALGPLAITQAVSWWVLQKDEAAKPWQREAAAVVQTLAVGAAMALVSQIYNLPGKWTDLVFWWCVVSVPLAWVLRSQAVAITYLVGIAVWTIAQEADPRTWDILLTTPLGATQIVLGNLFGRLFFILALLVSSLPLFAITQYFGGVPGDRIFLSYLIAACAALVVGSAAVALSVSRVVGKRAVFAFYVSVISYLAVTAGADAVIRAATGNPGVTYMTAINPFLTLSALLQPSTYPVMPPGTGAGLEAWFLERPVLTNPWAAISAMRLSASASARSRPFTPAFSRLLLSVTSSGITASGNTLPEKATSGCTSW